MILAKGMLHALKHDYCYTFLSQLLLVQCYQRYKKVYPAKSKDISC